ncbi:MAG: FKBP-type peptidyl-prolyl cis-trans isomerase [Crocinitomicaceae bacterium]|jgi:FKBP-type peptidyl-prolyl cis-trans isomerase
MTRILLCIFVLSLTACQTTIDKPKQKTKEIKKPNSKKIDEEFKGSQNNLKSFEKGKVMDVKTLANGIVIKWILKGEGRKLKKGEMALIDYRLALPDGKIVDGNNRINMPFIPFVIGYNMQTPGWDLSFLELTPGDFVKIEIPAELALGSKEIKGVIPANSPNWLYVKVMALVTPSVHENGITSWKIKKGEGFSLAEKPEAELSFHAMVSTESKSSVMNTRLGNYPLKYSPGQKTIVPGLRKLMKTAKKGERYFVILDAPQAYGARGYGNLVKPNEQVFYNIEVMDIRNM